MHFLPLKKSAGYVCSKTVNSLHSVQQRSGVLSSPGGLEHLLFVESAEDQRQMPPRLSFCMAVVFVVERLKNSPGLLTSCNCEENFRLEIGSVIRHTFAFF